MTKSYGPSAEVAEIRGRIDHPIIDGDGHIIEYLPLVRDILVGLGGASVAERFDLVVDSGRLTQMLSPAQRREMALVRMPWWGIPTRNTLDRATAMLPKLMYERLDEMGIDVAIAYPTYGLTAIHLTDDELRPALSRAFNVYVAEVYAPYRDRILPVACIPTFTPEEGIAELEHAVGELGLRAVMMGGAIPRPLPGRRLAGRTLDRRPRSRFDARLHAAVGEMRRSSASHRPFTRRAPVGAREPLRPTTCSTTSGTSRRRASSRRDPCSSAVFPCASRSCGSPSSRAAPRGRAISSATSSATGRNETAMRSGATTRLPSTARSSTRSSRSTPKVGCATASTASPTA